MKSMLDEQFRATKVLTWAGLFFIATLHAQGQWYVQQLPISQPLTDIYFADTVHGWVQAFDGLFHNTDGGVH